MSLPTSPTTLTKVIPSYLYYEYQNDPDLPALISAFNEIAQGYVDWFNDVNLPIYTGLNGALLDWVGQGIYGIPRPVFASQVVNFLSGQIASVTNHGPTPAATPNIADAISSTKAYESQTYYTTPDDVYKRVLTFWFYKADGFAFTIPWLKRRIYRFLHGNNGTDALGPFTQNISVTFDDSTMPLPTCAIAISNTSSLEPIATYFQLAVADNALGLPFRFQYTVTLT
jgi:hypothetical protein